MKIAWGVLVALTVAATAGASALPADRALARAWNEAQMSAALAKVRAAATGVVTGNATLRGSSSAAAATPYAVAQLQAALGRLEASEDSPAAFERAYRDAQATTVALVDKVRGASVDEMFNGPPGGYHLVRDVSFILDYSVSWATHGHAVQGLGVGTNLVGSAVGTLFNGAGVDWLGEYLKDNTAIAVGIPSHGSSRLRSTLSVGLGYVALNAGTRGLELWPTLDLITSDTRDGALPAEAIAGVTAGSSVSTFSISVSGVRRKDAEQARAGNGNASPFPIISVGFQIPQYYPGNGPQTLGALFGDDRTKFVRAGHTGFSVSVAYPLRKLTFAKS